MNNLIGSVRVVVGYTISEKLAADGLRISGSKPVPKILIISKSHGFL
jgi:hypothetical protein